jgi:uncharacterized membrane protein
MKVRSALVLLLIAATLGAALTGFYFVHENLPRAIRAPTSLILAPVAVVDGVCYAIGVSGIYGRPVPVLLVNWAFGLIVCCSVLGVKRWWRRRKAAASDQLVAQQKHATDSASRRR